MAHIQGFGPKALAKLGFLLREGDCMMCLGKKPWIWALAELRAFLKEDFREDYCMMIGQKKPWIWVASAVEPAQIQGFSAKAQRLRSV